MKWRDMAIQDLRRYMGLVNGIKNIKERIEIMELKTKDVRVSKITNIPHSNNSNTSQDTILDNLVFKEKLKYLLMADVKLVNIIERGVKALSEQEQMVIYNFYIDRKDNHIQKLEKKLHLERSQIYKLKDKALYNFTLNMYGITEY